MEHRMKMKPTLFAGCILIVFFWNQLSYAQGDTAASNDELKELLELAKDRYIVMFKMPAEGQPPIVIKANREMNLSRANRVPFGQHSTGQKLEDVELALNLNGEVISILDAINAIQVRIPESEVEVLRKRPDVISIRPVQINFADSIKTNPASALDRIDEEYPDTPDNTYTYVNTGAGQTIYVLDSGLDADESFITAEFGSRASMIYDFNGGAGDDCSNHGTPVSSVAAGNTYGVAKGATLIMAKVSYGCSDGEYPGAIADSLNWLAANESPGTIVNISYGPDDDYNDCDSHYDTAVKAAIIAATEAGILVFTSAGNDNCDIALTDWKNIPEAFVVGGLLDNSIAPFTPDDEDRKWAYSNYGSNISTWAPAENVAALTDNEFTACSPPSCGYNGTSFASPMVAGIAAIACEFAAGDCATYDALDLYYSFRAHGTTGTVLETNGGTLTSSPSRVIWQKW